MLVEILRPVLIYAFNSALELKYLLSIRVRAKRRSASPDSPSGGSSIWENATPLTLADLLRGFSIRPNRFDRAMDVPADVLGAMFKISPNAFYNLPRGIERVVIARKPK